MDRKEYLNLCREAAVYPSKPPKVEYAGIEYIPVSYELGFSSAGEATHAAILLDKNRNCIMKCPLCKINGV